MGKIKYNVKFPCGYEIGMEVTAGFFGYANGSFNEKDFKECPLHGKNCPPKR